MLEGGLISLLLLFSNPEKIATKHLAGVWDVRIDRTDLTRPDWRRIQVFEPCLNSESPGDGCKGHFGWIDTPGIYTNLLDKSFFTYEVAETDLKRREGLLTLSLNGESYKFLLDISRKELIIYQSEEPGVLMELRKVSKKELRRASRANPPNLLIQEDI